MVSTQPKMMFLIAVASSERNKTEPDSGTSVSDLTEALRPSTPKPAARSRIPDTGAVRRPAPCPVVMHT